MQGPHTHPGIADTVLTWCRASTGSTRVYCRKPGVDNRQGPCPRPLHGVTEGLESPPQREASLGPKSLSRWNCVDWALTLTPAHSQELQKGRGPSAYCPLCSRPGGGLMRARRPALLCCCFVCLFREGEGGEKEGKHHVQEKGNMDCLPFEHPQQGTWPATLSCVLTRK